ncbi:Uncharacterised protein [uncultured archaeon]|nr:Uncharacterised protein [uncultured archaeon]
MGEIMSSAGNIIKMLAGIVIFVAGIVWYSGIPGIFVGFFGSLLVLIEGCVGLLLLFVGLIVAWMGYDDYNMDKEMAEGEKKEAK